MLVLPPSQVTRKQNSKHKRGNKQKTKFPQQRILQLRGRQTGNDGEVPTPVTMAVRPAPSIPSVTSSAVEEEEKPDGPRLMNGHIAPSPSAEWILFSGS